MIRNGICSGEENASEGCAGDQRLQAAHQQSVAKTGGLRCGDLLRRAAGLVEGAREATHGKKDENFTNVATLWSSYLGRAVSPRDAALMMTLLKIARTKTGLHNDDDYVDGAGYLAIAEGLSCGQSINSVGAEIVTGAGGRVGVVGQDRICQATNEMNLSEERVVAIVDRSGSTRYAKTNGAWSYSRRMVEFHDTIQRLATSYRGVMVSPRGGDSIVCLFDDADSAMQFCMTARDRYLVVPPGKNAQVEHGVRAGISHGRVVRFATEVMGDPVNCAGNLCEEIAASGEILISYGTYLKMRRATGRGAPLLKADNDGGFYVKF